MALYRTVVDLNILDRGAIPFLRDAAAVHSFTMSGFQTVPTMHRQSHGVLWRSEPSQGGMRIVMQSTSKPDIKRLAAHPLAKSVTEPVDVGALIAAAQAGSVWDFYLRGNPEVSVPRSNRHRRPIYDLDGQTEWFAKRVAPWGNLGVNHSGEPNVAVMDQPEVQAAHRTGSIRKVCVDYRGRVQVTDPEGFVKAVTEGIGRGRAFGFGLLSVRPA